MARDRFTNPATGEVYDWPINHSAEEEQGKTRAITRAAPTGLTGLIRQQGDDGPFLLRYTGTILTRAQYQAFWKWYQLSASQTIYFRDFDGQEYEVQVTSFVPVRVRNQQRAGYDPIDHHWTYTMEMEVFSFRSGMMKTAGVKP